jgi:HEAT repeat protein
MILGLAANRLSDAQHSEQSPVVRARAVLNKGAFEADPNTRREVAVALSLIATRDPSAGLLQTLIKDKDSLVREAALVSVGELGDNKTIESIQEALQDDVPEVAFAAGRTLFKLKQPQGKQFLIEIVDKEARAKSGFAQAKLRDVVRRMKRPKSAILFMAQQGIGFVPVPGLGEGFSAMNSLIGDAETSARATALLLLATDRSPEVRRVIEGAFNDTDWSMRAAATQIAAMRNERSWRQRLIPLFEDTNGRVRYRAATSFLRLNDSTNASPARITGASSTQLAK